MSLIRDKREKQRLYELSYNRLYREYKKSSPFMEKYDHSDLMIEPSIFQFKGADNEEPRCCSEFGCGQRLSIQELLFGNKCINHQRQQKLDPSLFISK